ncbi:MAG TPA: hypothetical protein VFE37_10830 [Chloroflexota bacterium]|nr:hypothetical protein [Chloroflexota bacterium]
MSSSLLWPRFVTWLVQLSQQWVDLQRRGRALTVDDVLPDDGSFYHSFPWNCCS